MNHRQETQQGREKEEKALLFRDNNPLQQGGGKTKAFLNNNLLGRNQQGGVF